MFKSNKVQDFVKKFEITAKSWSFSSPYFRTRPCGHSFWKNLEDTMLNVAWPWPWWPFQVFQTMFRWETRSCPRYAYLNSHRRFRFIGYSVLQGLLLGVVLSDWSECDTKEHKIGTCIYARCKHVFVEVLFVRVLISGLFRSLKFWMTKRAVCWMLSFAFCGSVS